MNKLPLATFTAVTIASLSGCFLIPPIWRALYQVATSQSVTVEMTASMYGLSIDTVMEIEGHEIKWTTSGVVTYMEVFTEDRTVDLYTYNPFFMRWSKTNLSFEDAEYEPTSESSSYQIETNWVIQDDENPFRYYVVEDRLVEFDEYISFTDVDELDPTIESVQLDLNEDAVLTTITIDVDTLAGELMVVYEFSEWNTTSVTLPTVSDSE